MDLFITSKKGKLVQNNNVIKNIKLFLPKTKYIKGDLTTPFTILNRKFNEMDLIRHALKSKEKFATERLHDDYRKRFKSDPCIMYCD